MKRAVAVLALSALHGLGCGGSQPTPSEIWHDPALRPGEVAPATEGEGELLTRLGDLPSGQAVTLHGEVFVPEAPYDSASGRKCRRVRTGEGDDAPAKLACEQPEGEWVFVPDVFADGG